jgi:hypothetical protein
MRTRTTLALVCALWLAAPAARGAGFEGLRRDDDAAPAVAGRIDAVDESDRTFRIGGLTFEVPHGVDFSALSPGRIAEVTYREQGDRRVATQIRLRVERPQ